MKITPKQIEAVLALPSNIRFKHFIKVVADWGEVWGLYQDGWALAATDDGEPVFPLWPAKEYAQICAINEWSGYEPRSINLNNFLEVFLLKLKADGVLPGVFLTPKSKGITPSVDELQSAIETELKKY
jgi:hypothetical protein